MPYLRFKGFNSKDLRRLSPAIVKQFAAIAEIAEDKVKIELLHVECMTHTPCTLEIHMFQREQEKHNRLASSIHELLSSHGYPDVHIFFVILYPELYYKNGKSIGEWYKLSSNQTFSQT